MTQLSVCFDRLILPLTASVLISATRKELRYNVQMKSLSIVCTGRAYSITLHQNGQSLSCLANYFMSTQCTQQTQNLFIPRWTWYISIRGFARAHVARINWNACMLCVITGSYINLQFSLQGGVYSVVHNLIFFSVTSHHWHMTGVSSVDCSAWSHSFTHGFIAVSVTRKPS